MFKIENKSFGYVKDEYDLKNINLNISPGEVILLCGESGCGKTTLTRILNGLIPHFFTGHDSGVAYFKNNNIADIEIHELSESIGSVFQNPKTQFFNVDTTSEIVFGCENLGFSVEDIEDRFNKVTKDYKIENLIDRSIFKLSGGEKQKIACASVSAVNPDIIILDEPSSNLDYKSSWEFENIIQQWKNQGKTVIIAEHKLFFLKNVIDKVLFIQNGEILHNWTADEFKLKNFNKLNLRQLDLNNTSIKNPNYYSKNKRVISIDNFKFSYKNKEALNIKHINIPQNEIIAIIGENGAGKTTFVRCLCGLERSCKGKITINNEVLNNRKRLKHSFMVMQDVNHQLFTESVLDELLLSMDEENEDKAIEILKKLNLDKLKDTHPMALSGGEKQRVAIGSALASMKDILIFDEPTSGLDLRHMNEVSDILINLQKLGITSFIVTHDYELICEACSHVLHFENGKIIDSYQIDEDKLKKFFIIN